MYLVIIILLFWGQQAAAATTGGRQVSTYEPKPWRTLLNAPAPPVTTLKNILPGAYGIISALGTGNTLGVDTSGKLGAQATLQVWQNSFATQDWVFTGYNQIALTGNSNTCLCASGLAKLTWALRLIRTCVIILMYAKSLPCHPSILVPTVHLA